MSDQNSASLGNAPTGSFSFQGSVTSLRVEVKQLASRLKQVKEFHAKGEQMPVEDRGEVMANLTLAYRHLEDASMRLGKTIQAYDGGVSVYDRASTVGA